VPSFHHPNVLGLINSLAARGHRKFGWKRLHRGKLFIKVKQPNLAMLCRLRTRINPVNFVGIVEGTRFLGAIILVIFQIFKVLEAVNPYP